jgi:hypothetical protein
VTAITFFSPPPCDQIGGAGMVLAEPEVTIMSIQSKLIALVLALVAGTALLVTPEQAAAYGNYGSRTGEGWGRGPVARAPSCVRIPNLSKDGKTIFYSEVCA